MAYGWPGRASRLYTPDASILKHLSMRAADILCYIYNSVKKKISISLHFISIMLLITSHASIPILFSISLTSVIYMHYNTV